MRRWTMDLAALTLRTLKISSVLAATLFAMSASAVHAQEAQWIWSQEHTKEAVPEGATCHFRKVFTLTAPEAGQIAIAADDTYELYLNGRRIGVGESTKKLNEYDVTRQLARGTNVLAIKVSNKSGTTAAVVARVTVKERGGEWQSFSTDATWKSSLRALPLWNTALYNDRAWAAAQSFGQLAQTEPWDRRKDVPQEETSRSERFTIADDFEVQQVLPGDQTGSLVAMTFNEFGHILVSKEGGGLQLIHDSNGDSIPDKVRDYGDKVKDIQGILALNGDVYVTGQGPDGPALYRLTDKDRDGVLDDVRTLVKFHCEVLEHGPHGLVLGPDGLIYVLLGNHAQCDKKYEATSPHRNFYEGDLVTPRYEDPSGHAVGIKAPGGSIIRTDTEGLSVQLIAGGLRNPYDLAFNREGELFVHDADMESDEGLSWYRPTRLCHIIPGGEYGWRSGWAKFPDYFVDSLPPTLETGRGSPAGIVVYNHFMFPTRYHGAIFSADWSQGRILAIKLKREGATYSASSEVFLEGNPLNVTDLEVGPDGWLYFVTGGRGTGGGVYRVAWKGNVPRQISNIGTGLGAVIRQPQLQAAYSRQNIAALRKQMGAEWDTNLLGVALSPQNPPQYRLQALDLMQLYGPAPEPDVLITLSKESNELVRGRAIELMGLHPNDATEERLVELLEDSNRTIRRKACESLARAGQKAPIEPLLGLIASDDRYEAWAARRLLEKAPIAQWRELVLESKDHRLLIEGGLALMIADPSRENALAVLEPLSTAMADFVSDRDFVDMLRLIQVAIIRGELQPDDVPALRQQLAEEFPSGDALMNRELARVLIYLQESSIIDRYLAYLKSDAADVDKLHVAMYLRFLEDGWTSEQRMELLAFYEEANQRKGGGSYARYIINATRDFCRGLTEEEARQVLAKGEEWPNAALGAFYRLPAELDEATRATVVELQEKLSGKKSDAVQRLQVGIVAVLARSGDEQSMTHLREAWDKSPELRAVIAMGLSQKPDEENWSYVVRSLPHLEIAAAREICNKLTEVEQAPEESEPYRQAILLGLKMKQTNVEKEDAAAAAISLLEFWTGEELAAGESEEKQLEAWQKWFAYKYPGEPPAVLPMVADDAKYTAEELLEYLRSEEAAGDAKRGAEVFVKAQCAKCHRFDGKGDSFGPDLTTLTSRFSHKEVVESILFPSHVISSQYASKTVRTTDGRQITGLVTPGSGAEVVVMQANGEKITLSKKDIEDQKPSKLSSMPVGLLDQLSLEEIADLFALLERREAPALTRKPAGKATK